MKKVLISLLFLATPSLVYAADPKIVPYCADVSSRACFVAQINSISEYVLAVVGSIMVILLFVAGIKYLTAGGNSDREESAKKSFTGAVIGLFLVMGAYLILSIIKDVATANLPG